MDKPVTRFAILGIPKEGLFMSRNGVLLHGKGGRVIKFENIRIFQTEAEARMRRSELRKRHPDSNWSLTKITLASWR